MNNVFKVLFIYYLVVFRFIHFPEPKTLVFIKIILFTIFEIFLNKV